MESLCSETFVFKCTISSAHIVFCTMLAMWNTGAFGKIFTLIRLRHRTQLKQGESPRGCWKESNNRYVENNLKISCISLISLK